jgi:hypothetical protein
MSALSGSQLDDESSIEKLAEIRKHQQHALAVSVVHGSRLSNAIGTTASVGCRVATVATRRRTARPIRRSGPVRRRRDGRIDEAPAGTAGAVMGGSQNPLFDSAYILDK